MSEEDTFPSYSPEPAHDATDSNCPCESCNPEEGYQDLLEEEASRYSEREPAEDSYLDSAYEDLTCLGDEDCE